MPTETLFPFGSASRALGGGGPAWFATGADPRLDQVDSKYMAFSTGVAPDSESCDCTVWRKADGSVPSWANRVITFIRAYFYIASTPQPFTLAVYAANTFITVSTVMGIGVTPGGSPLYFVGAGVVAPPTRNNWADYVRDFLLANDLLISVIGSNTSSHSSWTLQLNQVYLEVDYTVTTPPFGQAWEA